jgi:hypothetical protein
MGIQLQHFAAASEIFFIKEMVCKESLRQLLIIVGCNKRSICNPIALDDLFVAKFLFAVNELL